MKRVLFITEKMSFMSDAITSRLKENGIEVDEAGTDITEISHIEDLPPIVILYLQTEDDPLTEMLGYLRDLIEEKELRFFVIATQDEFDNVMGSFPQQYITESFIRPVDLEVIAKRIQKESDALSKQEEFKTILIVDDDPTFLRSMKNLLSTHYKVFVANSGLNAITIMAKNHIDLILLDYEMPVVDGPKVLEMLRADPVSSGIPVMFLTSKGDKDSIVSVVKFKPEKYLLKSMLPKEIKDSIDEYFSLHK